MPRKSKAQKAAEAAAAGTQGAYVPAPSVASNIVLNEAQHSVLWTLQLTRDYIRDYCVPHVQEEMRLRKLLVAEIMPTPVEGTTNVELGLGYRLKVRIPVQRKLDDTLFEAAWAECPSLPGDLIEYKPTLNTEIYRNLTPEQRLAFDKCVTTTPGAPEVTLVMPGETAAVEE